MFRTISVEKLEFRDPTNVSFRFARKQKRFSSSMKQNEILVLVWYRVCSLPEYSQVQLEDSLRKIE